MTNLQEYVTVFVSAYYFKSPTSTQEHPVESNLQVWSGMIVGTMQAAYPRRKMLLFSAACAARVTELTGDPRQSELLTSIVADLADGKRGKVSVRSILQSSDYDDGGTSFISYQKDAERAMYWLGRTVRHVQHAYEVCASSVQAKASSAGGNSGTYRQAANAERAYQIAINRDIFQTPDSIIAIPPAWLAWNDGVVARMAENIYRERRFEDRPILADALEEAGCANAELLAHLRGPNRHVRGCWAIDLLLGKQ